MAIGNIFGRVADDIDDHRDFAVFNGVHNMWATFAHFVDDLRHNAVSAQEFCRAHGGAQAVAFFLQTTCHRQ